MEIYVGGLPWDITGVELEDLFKPFGEISRVSVVRDSQTGKTRGFGFVAMPDDEQARAAIAALNGFEMRGRKLRVNQSLKSRGPRGIHYASYKT